MPSLLAEFQQFEEDRIQYLKSIAEKFADLQAEYPGFYTSASDVITNAARSVQVDSDIQAFVAENRTGVTVPPDIQYIPYDSELPTPPKPNSLNKKAPAPTPTKGKYPYKANSDNDKFSNREWGLSTADRNLSADEQKK